MATSKSLKEKHPIVVVERDWKEYVGECLLIVFSVALALGLTEYFTSLHDKNKADEILHQLKLEIYSNRDDAQAQYLYHQQVFKLIDSAKNNPAFAKQILNNGEIHLQVLFPHGVVLHDMKDAAWQQAKQSDAFSRLDFETYSMISGIYSNQARFNNLEPSIEKILFSYEGRKQENLQTTLILIHDAVYGWAYLRTPELEERYNKAITALKDY